jgi:hypothetical protein
VEFSLICLPFFLLLFAIVDYAQIYFFKNSLQNAMREATRFATAGSIIQMTDMNGNPVYETNNGVITPRAINDSGGNEASRYECIRWFFQSNCVINIAITNITVISAPTVGNNPPAVKPSLYGLTLGILDTNGITVDDANPGPGNANDYVQVSAIYYLHTITPLFSYLGGYSRGGINTYPVWVSAIVKNEPALLNFQHPATNAGDVIP